MEKKYHENILNIKKIIRFYNYFKIIKKEMNYKKIKRL